MVRHAKKSFLVVFAPTAGNSRRAAVQKRLARIASRDKVYVETYRFVDEARLARRIERAIADGLESFVAAGGDGMVALVATQLLGRGYPIGIIPLGTANTLALLLGISLDVEEAIKVLVSSANTRTIDGLRIGQRLFLMNASVGLSSFSVKDLSTEEKSLWGRFSYVLAVIRHMYKTTPSRFAIDIDGKSHRFDATEVFITNTGVLGVPQFRICRSELADGKLEVLMLRKSTLSELVNGLLDVFLRRKRHSLHLVGSGQKISVTCGECLPVQADGDVIGQTPVAVEAVPNAATFIVP